MSVLGVDACKAGWVGIRLGDDLKPWGYCASTVKALVERAGPVELVAIDIPIALSDGMPRKGNKVHAFPGCRQRVPNGRFLH